MIKVVVFGSGNVATHLTKVFYKTNGINLVQVYARKKTNFLTKKNIPFTNNLSAIKKADMYILSISDDAISDFSNNLPLKNGFLVHTSGSVAMTNLNNRFNRGVFYPLQTISKNKKLNFKKVPICLEAEKNSDLKLLNKLAKLISTKVYTINSEQRKSLHVSAVFVNNFTNHLYKIASDICKERDVPFDILKPLILETAKKIKKISPKEAQTGPAKRNDKNTIEAHLKMLNDEQKTIYKILTKSIQNE